MHTYSSEWQIFLPSFSTCSMKKKVLLNVQIWRNNLFCHCSKLLNCFSFCKISIKKKTKNKDQFLRYFCQLMNNWKLFIKKKKRISNKEIFLNDCVVLGFLMRCTEYITKNFCKKSKDHLLQYFPIIDLTWLTWQKFHKLIIFFFFSFLVIEC